MCSTGECVQTGKDMAAALLCEQRELVARLNDLANCIEEDKNPASKARSKVLYSKEREQYVQLLRKVQPSPRSFASACNLEQPSPLSECGNLPTNSSAPLSSADRCVCARRARDGRSS